MGTLGDELLMNAGHLFWQKETLGTNKSIASLELLESWLVA
jgi:hypothetical protein